MIEKHIIYTPHMADACLSLLLNHHEYLTSEHILCIKKCRDQGQVYGIVNKDLYVKLRDCVQIYMGTTLEEYANNISNRSKAKPARPNKIDRDKNKPISDISITNTNHPYDKKVKKTTGIRFNQHLNLMCIRLLQNNAHRLQLGDSGRIITVQAFGNDKGTITASMVKILDRCHKIYIDPNIKNTNNWIR